MDKEDFEFAAKITRLANRGAKKAQEENHRLGLPNVYSLEGKIVYVYSNGTVQVKNWAIKRLDWWGENE